MCGGAGMRLWPVSREAFPKQFLQFGSDKTLFQQTLLRVAAEGYGRPVIVSGNDHRFIVADQLRELGIEADIVLEPERRDSCAAVVAAAALIAREDPATAMLVLAADHDISDAEAFRAHVSRGLPASRDWLITFGVRPNRPATGYGYIAPGAPLPDAAGLCAVQRFAEKPDQETAEGYISEGYLWNSGNFLFSAEVLLSEAHRLAPQIAGPVLQAVESALPDLDFIRLDPVAFSQADALSIDYAILEKSDRVAVVPSDFGWSDIGTWSSVRDANASDENGNVAIGMATFEDARDNLVHAPDRFTALIGVENVAVISTADALMVVSQDRAEAVKPVVEALRKTNSELVIWHRKVHRPWGQFEQIDRGEGYLVKRITVKPGGTLSLQSHRHRAEHWVVVSGTARATIDGDVRDIEPDQSIYVPLGAVHRLENPGSVPLNLIEVQTGKRLEEEDIIRYEDVYNRR
jgi:mannose-1-phosphate guanylyltransferase/mannose-6-phosphate isomerase